MTAAEPPGPPRLAAVPDPDDFNPSTICDDNAERLILGAAMANPTVIDELATVITGTDFYNPRHGPIWYAIRTLHAGDRPVDPVAVLDELRTRSVIREGDIDAPYLFTCYQAAPPASTGVYHAGIIARLTRQRRFADVAIRMRQITERESFADPEALDRALLDAYEILDDAPTGPSPRDDTLNPIPLTEFLATPDAPITYRLDQLWPAGGRVILSAQYKAGKSTLVANLLRSLADTHPFLGKFTPNPTTGRTTLIDDELDANMLRRWLREQQIEHTDHVNVLPVRGRLSTFNILDPDTRKAWAQRLRDVDTTVLIFDCLRPVLDSLGLSEDKDAGRFLVAFDELLAEAGITEAVVVHHAGHQGERSRGDSRLRDWPDVEWRIVREADDPEDTTGRRPRTYFSALGRDVDEPEGLLTYEPATRWLTLAGGNRKQTEADTAIPEILAYLTQNPGRSQREIENANPGNHSRERIRAALKRGIDLGRIDTSAGNRGARLHFTSSDWSER